MRSIVDNDKSQNQIPKWDERILLSKMKQIFD